MTVDAYERLRANGFELAGGLGDLQRRACVYHHLYADSGQRNVFPLIAAHGALWASGYFKQGMLAGRLLSLPYLFWPARRRAMLAALDDFADQFRAINRRVCAESYALYHYTRDLGATDFIVGMIGAEFAALLCQCHTARRLDQPFGAKQRAALFAAFFHWEQENIVAPAVLAAYAGFHWAAIKRLALRPRVRFAYFGAGYSLPFADFSSQQERTQRGLQAYQRAEAVGLAQVEQSLARYRLMPAAFHANPQAYFRTLALAA